MESTRNSDLKWWQGWREESFKYLSLIPSFPNESEEIGYQKWEATSEGLSSSVTVKPKQVPALMPNLDLDVIPRDAQVLSSSAYKMGAWPQNSTFGSSIYVSISGLP